MSQSYKHLQDGVVWAMQRIDRERLSPWTSGNASVREGDLMAIKPSGVHPDLLTQDDVPIIDITTGSKIYHGLPPSTDLDDHQLLYMQFPQLNAVVHTHSTYATVFAACGMKIPCQLTALADEFGGDVPCLEYTRIGEGRIAKAVVNYIAARAKAKAFLLQSHGVLTLGWDANPRDAITAAVKSAVMLESCAKVLWAAQSTRHGPVAIAPDEIRAAHQRYSKYPRYSRGESK